MQILKNNLERIKRNNPYLSSLICFNKALLARQYSTIDIGTVFTECVDRGDYKKAERESVLQYSLDLNKDYGGKDR